MKQINNGYKDYYYLSEDGIIYNSATKSYLKPDTSHKFKLKTIENTYKSISLKSLYRLIYNKNYCEDTIEDLPEEVWKEIPDTNATYFVSSLGRIKSYMGYKAILLKPFSNEAGYLRVDIIENGQRQTKLVHRIVANCFLPAPANIDYQLHHINGKRSSNNVSNLIWLSPYEHRKRHEEMKKQRRQHTNECVELEKNNH